MKNRKRQMRKKSRKKAFEKTGIKIRARATAR